MVLGEGLELSTDRLQGGCSTVELPQRDRSKTHEKRPTLRTWTFSGHNGPRAFLGHFGATCKRKSSCRLLFLAPAEPGTDDGCDIRPVLEDAAIVQKLGIDIAGIGI